MLLSAADVKDCVHKVQPVKYAEEICYNGTLILKSFSSGLEIGACNWAINGPKTNIACLSSSIFVSSHAMNFDYHALQGYDLILYSDFSPPDVMEDTGDDNCFAPASDNFSAIRYCHFVHFYVCISSGLYVYLFVSKLAAVKKLYFLGFVINLFSL